MYHGAQHAAQWVFGIPLPLRCPPSGLHEAPRLWLQAVDLGRSYLGSSHHGGRNEATVTSTLHSSVAELTVSTKLQKSTTGIDHLIKLRLTVTTVPKEAVIDHYHSDDRKKTLSCHAFNCLPCN